MYQDQKPVFGKFRKLSSKELAAVCLAIFGEPEHAKDKPRLVFEKVGGKKSSYYERVFETTNVAAQWLLPFELLRHAHSLIKDEAQQARKQCGDDPDCPAAVRARIGAYGRYRMIHLAYGYLKVLAAEHESDFISAMKSEQLLKAIANWAPPLLQVGLDAIVDGYEDARNRSESSGLREFFREKKHQKLIQDRFSTALARTERAALREQVSLREFLRIPTI